MFNIFVHGSNVFITIVKMALPKVNFQVIIHSIMILTNVSFASL